MSFNYLENLPIHAQNRYKCKLKSVALDTCPYKLPSDSFVNDPTQWPEIQYPDIYHYLIDSPGK